MGKTESKREKYHEDDLKKHLGILTEDSDLSFFYKEPCVYNDTIIKETNVLCYDYITDYLIKKLNNNDLFKKKIKPIYRIDKNYDVGHKKLKYTKEKWFAKSLIESKLSGIGEIIDFETPINNTRNDKAGKIDLLAYNGKQFSLIELKLQTNPDSMLHTLLEIHTYFHQIDTRQLRSDFGKTNAKIQKVVLIFKGSRQHLEYEQSISLKKLANVLDIKIYLFDCIDITKAP